MITVDSREILKAIKDFEAKQKVAKKEIVWGVNDAAKTYKKAVPDIVREFYTIKKGVINKRTEIQKAKQKNPTAKVKAIRISRASGKGSPPSLFSFKKPKDLKKKKGGVQIEPIKGRKVVLKGAFIQEIGGNPVIMARKDPRQKTPYKTRGFHGPSIGSMLKVRGVRNRAEIKKILDKQMIEVLKGI